MQQFIEAGKTAHANGDMRAPALNADVMAALAGNKVGDPRNLAIMQAFTDGYDAAVQAEIDAAEIEVAADVIMTNATNPDFTREQARRQALYAAKTPAGTKFTIWHGPKSAAKGRRVLSYAAERVAEFIPEGGAAVVFTSFKRGAPEGMSRSVFVRIEGGIAAVDSSGNVAWGVPFGKGRTLRVLVK